MTDFATLVLAADTRQMTQAERAIEGVIKAGERAETQTNNTANAIDYMDKMARRAALGAVALVGSVVALTRSSANQIDALAKQARQVGILTQDFQAMSLVANEAGVSTENLTNMIGLMQRNVVELGRGTASQTRAFQQLGVSLQDLQGLSPDQQFDRIATALAGVQDPAQRTALAMEVFGRSGRAAINMLDGYTDALEDARRFQEGFGLAVGQQSAQAVERANDALGRLGMGFRGLGNILAVELAPRLERFANSMIETIIQSNAIQRTANVLIGLFDRIGFYAGAAAIAFGVYKVATIAATVATVGLSSALVVARAALLRLGLGIIIVAAGELAFRISKLIESTGGWGNALSLLGQVASGVWQGITTSASAILPGLASVWQSLRKDFLILTSDLTQYWADFLGRMANALEGVPVFKALEEGLRNASTNVTRASGDIAASAIDAAQQSERLAETARNNLTSGFQIARDALSRLNTTVEQNIESTENGTDAANALNVALDNVSGGAGGAGAAVKGLNDDLQQTPQWVTGVSDAFADLVMRGFKDFASFAQSVVNTFRNMLRDMIAMAARNRIMISLGMAGAATPAMAGSGLPGIGGMMSSAVGGFGGGAGMAGFAGGTGFLGGVGNVIGGLASGGLAGGGAAISTALAGATSSLSGFAMAAGAIALPLAAAAAVFSFFSGKTKELDRGMIVTVQNMDTLVQSFSTVEKSRFWGLSKRISTTIETAADNIANPIIDAVSRMQQSVLNAASILGVGEQAFANFTHTLNLSLRGLNEQQAIQKVTEELAKMGDAFAAMVPGVSSMNELLAVASQRYDLTTRLLQLQGDEEELLRRHREQEVNAVHGLNSELLLQIHALEDATIAAEKAAVAAQRAAEEEQNRIFIESQIARERESIERRMLELQGDTAALRQRELESLNPANRALAENIFALEDQARAAAAASSAAEEAAKKDQAIQAEMQRLQTRILQLQGDTNALRERELAALDPASRSLQEMIFALEDQARATEEATRASEEAARAERAIAEENARRDRAIFEEAQRLQTRILQLQDDTNALRDRELAAVHPLNRALQEMIFALEDSAKAAQEAAQAAEQLAARQRAVAQERFNLETRLLQVQGNTAALRERELVALDPENRQLLETIFAIEDAQRAAAEAQRRAEERAREAQRKAEERAREAQRKAEERAREAQRKAEERAREQERIAQERFNLETKILQLQGNTAALRRRELEALDPSNRALQRFIYGLEDAKAALDAITSSDFATGVDFDRATALARIAVSQSVPSFANGGVHGGGLRLVGESGPELEVTGPSRIFNSNDTMSMLSNAPVVLELRKLKREFEQMRDEQRQLGIQTAANTDRSYRLLRSWDVVGLPEERTA
jgi:hypothetical protein